VLLLLSSDVAATTQLPVAAGSSPAAGVSGTIIGGT
jgi:hypothetical protein